MAVGRGWWGREEGGGEGLGIDQVLHCDLSLHFFLRISRLGSW